MISLYSELTFSEVEALILALEAMLNNPDSFSDPIDQIFLQQNTPNVIKKLSAKKTLDGNDLFLILTTLEYANAAINDFEPIKKDDLNKIKPLRSVYRYLYQAFCLFLDTK